MAIFRNFIFGLIGLSIVWHTPALSQELGCTIHPTIPNIISLTIPSKSRLGPLNMLYVQHDTARKIPFASTSLLNYLNLEQNATRNNKFHQHPCNQDGQLPCQHSFVMTPEQRVSSNGRTSWDRGHLSPSNPFRYSTDANIGTFLCINVAPQDPFTNQKPWNFLEQDVLHYFRDRAGFVMTGVCDRDSLQSPTRDGFPVPDCHWKLACYTDLDGVTQVVGWIGSNTIVPRGDKAAEAKRRLDTLTPRSQQDIIDVLTINHFPLLMEAWQGAETYLMKNRNETRLPTAQACMAVRELSPDVRDEWTVATSRMEKEQEEGDIYSALF